MTANFDIVAPKEGTTSNRYKMLGRLAGGGMAEIFLARASTIAGVERHVVLKRVLAEHGSDPQFAKMFLDEARLAIQLHHPNIAQVHDVGMIDGAYFFTMEFVHGKDLRALLEKIAGEKRRLPLNLILHIAVGVLAALHHAHELTDASGKPLGIVHRDISPSNVMVSYEGTIKLLDFGVAKATQNTEETRPGVLKGKIAYFSPEQCRTSKIDRRSDLYSAGILLHEMLTCRRLYRHESDFDTMNAIVSQPTVPPSHFRGDVPPALDTVVLRALQKDPSARFETAAEMAEALEEIAAEQHLRLSASAMARFIRELFGERMEPWKEVADDAEISITVHGAPVVSLALGSSPERAVKLETSNDLPDYTALARKRRLRLARNVVAGAALAVAAAVTAFVLVRSDGSPGPKQVHAATRVAPPAAAPQVPAPHAEVAAPEVAAAPPTPTIESMFDTEDWIATLQLCVARTSPTASERSACAIAACNARQRGVAAEYYSLATASTRPVIERACRTAGITVRASAPARPRPVKVDPCESDPLQCQK